MQADVSSIPQDPLIEILQTLDRSGIRLSVGAQGQLSVKAPKGVLTAAFKQLIADNKPAIVERLRNIGALLPLPAEQRALPSLLSFGQQRLWFLERYEPGSARYTISTAVRLRGGAIDIDLLQAAIDALLARHDVLRTVFIEVDGEPRQCVQPTSVCPIAFLDLGPSSPAEQRDRIDALMQEEAVKPFDLTQGPLVRISLVRLTSTEHVLLINLHHIVADDWSMTVLIQEVVDFYTKGLTGVESEPPALALQYLDYAVWQRQRAQGGLRGEQLAYWRGQLAGAPEVLDLPADRPRPPVQTYRGASLGLRLDRRTVTRLKALGQAQGATLFMVLQAAFCVLLHRYSGQRDLCIGVPTAGRSRLELEPLIGFFVNTLVLRAQVQPFSGFNQLLEQVKASALQAYANQDVPFEQVVSELKLTRSLSHTPLFQVMMVMQNAPRGGIEIPGLRVEPLDVPVHVSKFDLTCTFMEDSHEGHLLGGMEYNSDLFDEVTIARYIRHFQALLQDICERPLAPIHTLRMLSPDDMQQMLCQWNDTQSQEVEPALLHRQFERQAQITPDACAAIYEDHSLTYQELETRSRQLAGALIEQGIGAGHCVAVLLDRSLDIFVALFGILRAGAAYVPLDPSHPAERLTFMLADCCAGIVLSDRWNVKGLHLPLHCRMLESRSLFGPDVPLPSSRELPTVAGNDLAYVIYTSGSTGVPKGVMVEHRNVVNLLQAMQRRIPIGGTDAFLSVTTLSFDIAALELFLPLVHGACVVLAPRRVASDPQLLASAIDAHAVTLMQATPSTWRMLAEQGWPSRKIRVLSGGEPLPAGLRNKLHAYAGSFWNLYGPTETTIWSTSHCFEGIGGSDVTIGKPVDNTQVYVLGAAGELLPVGGVGEIYIGGAGVSRGYLNRPSLTAQRFVPDPFGTEPGARLYRTGDLGRWRADGSLEYSGRSDFQVKVRGTRIELGEIESKLVLHEQVSQSVVDARPDAAGNQQLVAYVVPQGEAQDELVPVLRAYLRAVLPEHMLPSVLVFLKTLPLTVNGKVDRKALPVPERVVHATAQEQAPRSEQEHVLVEVWQSVLGLEEVGRNDHFFELGGHSLLAVSMVARLRKYGFALDVHSIFALPRLADMALALREACQTVVPPNTITPDTTSITAQMLPLASLTQADIDLLVQRVPGGVANIQDIYALSPMQDGILFHHLLAQQGDPYLMAYEIAFTDRSLLDRYLEGVEQVIARHDILRTSFFWRDLSTPVQVVWRQAPLRIVYPQLDERHRPVLDQLRKRYDPHLHSIDIAEAGLLRASVAADPQANRWLLHLRLHHLVGDHLTLHMLNDEVVSLLADKDSTLPPVRRFRDFVAQTFLEPNPGRYERFFREHLSQVREPSLPFGVAHVDPAHTQEHRQLVPSALLQQLDAHARRLGVNLGSLCHLAWGLVVARTSACRHVVFGTVLLGRASSLEFAEQAMGLLINTLPLYLELKDLSVDNAVLNTHASLTALLRHEHASLALAQRCSRISAPAPLFSALLNYRRSTQSSALSDSLPMGMQWLGGQVGATYPFCLTVEDQSGAMELIAHVAAPIPAKRICEYMLQAMHGLASAMEQGRPVMIDSLDILRSEERRQVLQGWNDTAHPAPAGDLVQLFEAQVARTPTAQALCHGELRLSYAELNARANAVAHALLAEGIGAQDVVALAMPRSVELVVGIWAVLKTGAAYLPLDLNHPVERLSAILQDVRPRRGLCLASALEHLPALLPWQPLDGAFAADWLEGHGVQDPLCQRQGEQLAYVVHTSGSTGQPKGVMVTYAAITNKIEGLGRELDIVAGDRMSLLSGPSFDALIAQMSAPMIRGGCVVVIDDSVRDDPGLLWAYVRAKGINILSGVPSYLAHALQSGDEKPQVRHVLLGGEAVSTQLCRDIRQALGAERITNLYGPTEATCDATGYRVVWDELDTLNYLPIGMPSANYQVYVLDERLEPVPAGVAGEIYLAGMGLARGYLGQGGLTAQSFIPNPHGPAGSRMYRTGDLGQWRDDGCLLYRGRADQQMKINGVRMEPGEIEATLVGHAAVAQAAVVLREASRLVGYVVLHEGQSVEVDVLRHYLLQRLPAYMVPSALIVLESLPRTANDKLDLRALPEPSERKQESRAPRNEQEARLCRLFAEVLGVDSVGIDDSFFELGGHSLLAMRLVNAVREELGVDLAIRSLFEAPTVAQLVGELIGLDATRPPLIALPRPALLPLSFAQQRLWFLAQLEGDASTYTVPIALRLHGDLNSQALQAALADLAIRHESLRTCFHVQAGEPWQVIAPQAQVDFAESDIDAAELESVLLTEVERPFALDCSPPWRARLLRLAPDEQVLLLMLHHIVTDGASQWPLLNDLGQAYQARCTGAAPGWPVLSIQYADYSVWQRRWLGELDDEQSALAHQLAYWRHALQDLPVQIALPTDRPRPAVASPDGGVARFQVSGALHQRLQALANERRATLFMVLQAAFAGLLSRLGAGHDIPIGSPIAGRVDESLDPLVGFFVNTLVLRTDTRGNPDFLTLIDRVRSSDLEAYSNQDFPFERLVEALNPVRSLAHHALFQVSMTLEASQGPRLEQLAFPGLTVSPLGVSANKVKFDLSLMFSEEANLNGMHGALEYRSDLFDPATAEALAERLVIFLEAATRSPEAPLGELDILLPGEQGLVLHDWDNLIHAAGYQVHVMAERKEGGRAARTEQEVLLCELFARLLGLDLVGIDDGFFDLGGHSLLAMRLVNAIREELCVDLAIRDLFEAPTVAQLVGRLKGGDATRPPLIALPRPALLPLSFAQQRLWFLAQLEGDASTYTVPIALRLHGDLNSQALQAALADLAIRHESLRTCFHVQAGEPWQVIAPQAQVDFAESDIDAAELESVLLTEVERPFALDCSPPWRARLLRLAPDEQVLLLMLHHIVTDGASQWPLLNDLGQAYQARCTGAAPGWPVLSIQYADYSVWQRRWLGELDDEQSALAHQLAYWRHALQDLPVQIALPTDRPRPAVASPDGGVARFQVSGALHQRLQALANERRATLFMVLQAAFAGLLSRLGAGHDIPIGSPIAGRVDESLDPLVGFFVNTLVLRTDTRGNPDFLTLIDRVRSSDLEAYSNQDFPFERLVEALNPVRSLAHHALFQVSMTLEASQGPRLEQLAFPGLTVSPLGVSANKVKFDLSLMFSEEANLNGMHGALEYRSDLFDPATAEALAERLVIFLEAATQSPEAPLGELDILHPEERRQVLQGWNDTAHPAPAGDLVQLFEAQVARTPTAQALCHGELRLSYAELNARANAVAHALLAEGIGAQDVVALAMPRSVELVVGIWAVLKTGAAYLPLDLNHPVERLSAILQDVRPRRGLCLASALEHLPALLPWQPLDGAFAADWLEGHGVQDPLCQRQGEQLAYVVHTSGSTGQPKGVMVTYAAITNKIEGLGRELDIVAGDRMSLLSGPSFDALIAQMSAPMIRGGCVVVIDDSVRDDPGLLWAYVRAKGINILSGVPSYLAHALQSGDEKPQVRHVLLGGEAVSTQLCRDIRQALGAERITNLYGPTEATCDATGYRVVWDELDTLNYLPIGMPSANYQVYVLDERLEPVPAGVAGEIYLAGMGLARGYLGQGGLTAQSFIPNPHGPAGSRMYRTGDLGQWRDDGCLLYRGRADQQMKINGVRMEPGEIEATLVGHAAVAQAAVVLREASRLVGYVVLHEGQSVEVDVLRHYLLQRLPAYMVPSALIVLESLPRTANDKLDLRALPEPSERKQESRAPRNEQEARLCRLFAEVLGVDSVGIDDSFFELGGHSLLAMRLVNAVREELGVDLAIRSLFEAPTVAQLVGELIGLDATRPPLIALPRPALLPLSFAQQRLWFLAQLEGDASTYTVPIALRLHGDLNSQALQAALADLAIRHESLRTCFHVQAGEPWQVIAPQAQVDFAESDIDAAELESVLLTEVERPFALDCSPPWRARLLRLAPDEQVLLLMLHHIVTDGASQWPLLNDLGQAYQARCTGAAPGWPVLSIQYADYSVWQRRWLGELDDEQSALAHQLAYWRHALQDLPVQIALPTDRPRPAVASPDGGVARFQVSGALHQRLQALANERRATLFMVLQAAFAGLLSRLGAGHDIPIGSPIAGRVDESLDPLVGFFVNTLVLRTDTRGNPDFLTLIDRVRSSDLEAYSNQDFPFERLVEALNPVRSLAHHALFQVSMTLEASQGPRLEQLAFPGLTVSPLGVSANKVKFDLSLMFSEEANLNGMHGALEYRSDLFDPATAEALAERLVIFLEAATQSPEAPLGELDILHPEERRQVLQGWNDTAHPAPAGDLVQLFEAQVARTPTAQALCHGELRLSYAELNARANAVAHALLAEGIGAQDVVALAMPRSVELVVGIWAVLKTGAAYLPLDLNHPVERLSAILQDVRPRRGLCLASALEHLPALLPWQPLDGAFAADWLEGHGVQDPLCQRQGEQLAYVVHTSGSTGQPKGVMVTYAAIANKIDTRARDLGIAENDRVSLLSGPSFDALIEQVSMPLIMGACLVVIDDEVRDHLQRFWEYLRAQNVSVLYCVPSYLAHALQSGSAKSQVRHVILGGEALSAELCRNTQQALKAERITNLYGPTEATVDATGYRVVWDELDTLNYLPIGMPSANYQVYVLDERLEPVPAGVAGEIYLAGMGLARGYLGQGGLTAQSFIPNPHGPAGSRMYRTGDLGQWRDDGCLLYRGRADQQMKINGVRMEPGEIEATLVGHAAVAQAAVVLREASRLVGYVVLHEGQSVEVDVLRHYLLQRLPAYMVPSALIVLESLPRTANDKLDLRALPEPSERKQESRAPRNEQEARLCRLFAEVLGVDSVGIDDSFFELGGHSLLAMRLVNAVREELGVDLAIRSLFEAPTVAQLVGELIGLDATRPPLIALPRPALLPLSFAQQRLWFLAQLEGDASTYTVPIALRLHGDLNSQALQAALADLAIRHESLRTCFHVQAGEPWQVIAPQAQVDFAESDIDAAELESVLLTEVERPFALDCSPPWRARLLRLAPDEQVLLLMLHHIVTDGASQWPLLNDLGQAYQARCTGAAPGWPVLSIQYADYSVWQRRWLGELDDEQSALAHQLAYWRHALQDLPVQIALPTDRPRPAVASPDGGVARFQVSGALHQRLQALANERRATLFMVLQAAFAGLLSRLGAGHDIPIGSPIAGRVDESLDPLVGFFVNTLVLRTDTRGNPDFLTLIDRVRSSDLEAYSNQDFPFERLVEALNPVRSLAHHALFQVSMTLEASQGPRLEQLAFPGLTVSPLGVSANKVKFDLSLMFSEEANLNGMHGALEYRSDLFDPATAEALAERLVIFLEAATQSPEAPLGELDILHPEERRQVLQGWNDTAHPAPAGDLVQLFEAQVARTPTAQALCHGELRLSYAELNARANAVAHALLAEGIGAQDVVALAMPRSVELVVGIWAVLKTGAAYLPLDLNHPVERLSAILQDVRPRRGLCLASALEHLPALLPWQPLDGAFAADWLEGHGVQDPLCQRQGEQLAYVVHTSGSTGQPKGVMVTYAAITNKIEGLGRELDIVAGDRMSLLSGPSFDALIAQMSAPMIRGGCVVVIDDSVRDDPGLLWAYVRAKGINILSGVPSYLAHALQSGDEKPQVRHVLLGGEAVSTQLCRDIRQALGAERITNLYGPTEATCDATGYRVVWDELDTLNYLPIGMPSANYQVYVLDERLEPVPAGVAGEIYLAGMGLARGYLGQGGLTAQSFIPNPHGPAGSRMYRTGDLGQWRDDGCLLYRGRADQQMKINGVRMEPGEIEATLVGHAAVAQAAVVLREASRLVGYVVLHEGQSVEVDVLRHYLLQRLPAYMVPSALIVLESLPRTANDKLDLRALPEPSERKQESRAPRNEQEARLCRLFAEVLGVDSVGIDDSFFELGGHSLLAMRLVNAVREELGVDLAIRSLFEAPTVAQLAEQLKGPQASSLSMLLPLRTQTGSPTMFCMHPGRGLCWPYSQLIRHLPGVSLYGLQARGIEHDEAPAATLKEMIQEYVDCILNVQPAGPYHLIGWSFGGRIAFEVACTLSELGHEVGEVILLDARVPVKGLNNKTITEKLVFEAILSELDSPVCSEGAVTESLSAFHAYLHSQNSPLGMLDVEVFKRVVKTSINNTLLGQEPIERKYSGKITYFSARRSTRYGETQSEQWRHYVTDPIQNVILDCLHDSIVQEPAVRDVGEYVVTKIALDVV
ncbi:non-ribosomal peptide synthase/polyketide synthase [Pseudomonas amygdali]|uniref:non-ribosomal peptide synthase/polyketide synthase n=5 Tax=Pseudomonas amygdali TaxID=47877 RepID=UPI001CD89281|nr:non-ribosomal peptide synthase/polyketide synthase [Pseudomonas amygdali]UBT81281.1 non-ribosomal peptide synthase/polyketide synthase [Pseudomonas amygdali]